MRISTPLLVVLAAAVLCGVARGAAAIDFMTETAIVLSMIVRRAKLVVERPENVRMQSTVTLQVAGGLPVRVEMRRGVPSADVGAG